MEGFSEVEVIYNWLDIPAFSVLDFRMQSIYLGTVLAMELKLFKVLCRADFS